MSDSKSLWVEISDASEKIKSLAVKMAGEQEFERRAAILAQIEDLNEFIKRHAKAGALLQSGQFMS